MKTHRSSIHFQKEMTMTEEKTQAEKRAEKKEEDDKRSGKKYDGGEIPKSSRKKSSDSD